MCDDLVARVAGFWAEDDNPVGLDGYVLLNDDAGVTVIGETVEDVRTAF